MKRSRPALAVLLAFFALAAAAEALDKVGAKYQWMVMDGEGHGFRDPANQKAFYEAVEKFLAENLKPARAAAADAH